MDNGCQRNKRDPALAGVAGFGTRFDGLPIDVLLEVVSHTNVSSAIKMTMVCNPIVIFVVSEWN